MPPRELAATLENRSGLAGLAGTGDMREVLSRAAAGDARAGARPRRLPAPAPRVCRRDGGRAWRPRRARLHRRRRRELPGDPLPRRRTASASSASPIDESRNTLDKVAAATTGRSPRPAPQARTFVIAAREDRQIAAEVRSLWPSVIAV